MFTNSNGTATTTAARLTVGTSSSEPAVTTQPSNQTVIDGATTTFIAAASGTPTPAVQWQVSTDGGTTWVDLVAMAASPTYSFTAAASDSGKQYRAVFTNSVSTATTNAGELTVHPRIAGITDYPIADFNGDGKQDILLRNSNTGQLSIWLMNGTSTLSVGSLTTIGDLNWQIITVADFNGDGRSDILWRNSASGQFYVWLMNGTVSTSLGSPGTLSDPGWQIKN